MRYFTLLQEKQEEDRLLTLDGFLSYVVDKAKQDVRAVWRGLMSCGFDLHYDRFETSFLRYTLRFINVTLKNFSDRKLHHMIWLYYWYCRCCCIDTSQGQEMSNQWNPDMDAALVLYINRLCQHLSISPARLHPHEIYLTEAELASIDYACLQGR